MNNPKAYDEYSKMTMPELCEIMANFGIGESKANIARLIYEERQMAQKHKYEKEQIELQHSLNRALLKEQLDGQGELIKAQIKSQTRWMKFSIIGILIASIIGAIIGAILQPIVSRQLAVPYQSIQERKTEQLPQEEHTSSVQGHQAEKEPKSSIANSLKGNE